MIVNDNIKPRPLTEQELADRKRGVFDSYANYLVYCGNTGYGSGREGSQVDILQSPRSTGRVRMTSC